MSTPNPNTWGICPHGEWQRLSAGLSLHSWMLFVRNLSIGLIAATALAGATWAAAAHFNGSAADETCPCHPPVPVELETPDCGFNPDEVKKQ